MEIDILWARDDQGQDYDYGAWKIVVKLDDDELAQLGVAAATLSFPDFRFEQRVVYADGRYRTVAWENGEPHAGGRFIAGVFEGHGYTNGVPEVENVTHIEEWERLLREHIERHLGLSAR